MLHGASGNQKDDHRTNTLAKHLRRPPPTTPVSANFVVSSSARSGQTVALKCQAEVLPSQYCGNVHFLAAIRHRVPPPLESKTWCPPTVPHDPLTMAGV